METVLISNINPLKMKMNMKKIISWGIMLAAAFTLTNCAKEIDAPVQEPESVGYPFEIVASTVDTKTVNEGMSTKWAADDQINLFHAVGETTVYVNNNAFTVSDLAEGRFTGNLASELDPQEEYDWFAFYPYSSYIKTPANTSSGYMTVGSSASGVQVQNGNDSMSHIAGENYPLVGSAIAVPANSTPKMEMSHVSSLIAVNVKNTLEEPLVVESVSFNAPVEIVGTYYINFAGDITPESFTGSGDKYVSKAATLNVEEGTAIATGQSAVFYLAVKPFVAKTNDKLVITVNGYAKELTMTKDVTFSAGKIKTLNFAYDKVKEAGLATATISFASDAQRTSFSGEAQVWENDGITFTNTKANSTNAVVNNVAPVRLYKNSAIKIEAPGLITKIEFNSATGDYFTSLKSLLPNASVSGQIVTEVYDGSSTSVSYSLTTGQIRLNSITVTYSSTGENPDQPENPEPEVVTLSSIKVSDDAKTEYTVGDAFVEPVVTATYSDSSTKEVTAEFSGYNMVAAGTYTVNVSYTENEVTVKDSYEIVVKAKEDAEIVAHIVTWDLAKDETSEASESNLAWDADGVSMVNAKGTSQNPATNYYPGTSGKTYTSTRFYKGNKLTIAPKQGYAIKSVVFTATSTNYANDFAGSTWTNAVAVVSETTVTINPEDGREDILASITGTCGFTKVVVDLVPSEGYVKPVVVLSSIALSGQTTNYTVGDTFSFTGTVTATYSNGATKTVTPTKVSSPDMSTAGDKEVTVTYTEGEVSATAKYTIKVAEKVTEPEEPSTTPKFVKVTSDPSDWSGTYLIVYESGKVAFDGSRTTLDAASNTKSVTISNGEIEATDALMAITFTITKSGTNYTVKSKSGYYIGQTSNANGLKSSTSTTYANTMSFNSSDKSVNFVSGSAYLRFNAASSDMRFRYYKSSSYTNQKAIHLYKLVN